MLNETSTKYIVYVAIAAIVMIGLYAISEKYFAHIERMQQVSRQIIE